MSSARSFDDLVELGADGRLAAALADLPSHLILGRVARVDRGACTVLLAPDRPLRATSGPHHPVVGDWAAVDDGDPPTVAHLVDRRTAIERREAGGTSRVQALAANVDVVFVVQAMVTGPNLRRLERELVVAWESGAEPVVVLTKADLVPPDERAQALDAARSVAPGVAVIAAGSPTGLGIDDVRSHLVGRRTGVVLGASGTGKSTLLNAVVGAELQSTGPVRDADHKGRHTTTAGQLLSVPGGGLVIDTPGLRALALWSADDGIERVFGEIDALAERCRFADCAHTAEPGCAVRDSVDPERLDSWRRLQREAARTADDRAGWQKAQDAKALRAFHRSVRGITRPG